MIARPSISAEGRLGDGLEVRGIHGQPARRGRITELLGAPHHRRYRVLWDDEHESIVYPADGVMIVPREAARRH